MKITPDDPRLTAYALGELDEAERKSIEAELNDSPECRRAVEEIRQTATVLTDELAAEELPELDFAQQRAVEAKLKPSAKKTEAVSWWKAFQIRPGFVGALAVIALIAVVASMLLPSLAKAKYKSKQASAKAELRRENITRPMDSETTHTVSPPRIVVASQAKGEIGGAFSNSSDPLRTQLYYGSSSASGDSLRATVVPRGGMGGGGGGGGQNILGGQSIGGLQLADGYNLDVIALKQSLIEVESEVERPVRRGVVAFRQLRLPPGSQPNTATYPHLIENSFLIAAQNPLSTFSIDVDTASYANVRRFLNSGQLPPTDAVRIEEMINYFTYNYPQPRGEDPFSANVEIAGCPWNSEHRLVRVGLKGREIARDKRPPSNFVFLLDVSGSMGPQERLPLIKQALRQLVKKMTANDRVAIVVYASQAGVRLNSTPCTQKEKILEAIDSLGAGGSTAGAAGIQAAYQVASENFIEGGVNRVLLCTDGDFNVGMTDQGQLVKLIQQKAKSGVFLTTLGVGTDNYKDALMQKLADKGNGNYHYLDTLEEAQKVLIDQMSGTLVTIAKDVKIQIEFNPSQVGAYRLIGYEKRMLRKEDFNNDKKDAGEIGAGHTVTALYEITPPGAEIRGAVDDLKYQQPQPDQVAKAERYASIGGRNDGSRELLTLKLRYKQPDGDTSKLLEFPVTDGGKSYSRASADFKFAAAVASFGMVLRESEFKGNASLDGILEFAEEGKGRDESGYRSEFIQLVKQAKTISKK